MRAIWILFVVGCASQYHVTLPAPSPTITPDARVATFWKMLPRDRGIVTIQGRLENETITLADGHTEVVSPEDLEPLVPENSDTMRYARESVRARKKSHMLFNVSVPVFVGGACVYGFGEGTISLVGAAIAVVALIPYALHRRYNSDELALRRKAFEAYPTDLGRRLNVCAHGNLVIPCEAPLTQSVSLQMRD